MTVAATSRVRLDLHRSQAFELNVDLTFPSVGVTALLGPSGAGKSTVLRCIAGLEQPESACIEIAGESWEDSRTGSRLPAWRRPIGYVFQESRLFSHLDVRANIEFGLRRQGGHSNPLRRVGASLRTLGEDARTAMDAAVSLLGIGHLLDRRTDRLSGGERQRVAIARALALQPRLLLLDEPLSALDTARRQEVLPWLEQLRDESGIPMLYVTHSIDEVARLASTVVLMKDGRATACGPVAEILMQSGASGPADWDACTLIEGQVAGRDAPWMLMHAEFPGGHLWIQDDGSAIGRAVRLRVLARDVSLATALPTGSSIQNQLPGRIEAIETDSRRPGQTYVTVRCGAHDGGSQTRLLAQVTTRAVHQLGLSAGQPVWAQVKAVALVN